MYKKNTIKEIKIATRSSKLALWQANCVAKKIKNHYPDIKTVIIKKVSKGDQLLNNSLSKIGGKGLFIKELERALISREADIAVHSVKDLPVDIPKEFLLSTICRRENPHDAFLSNHYSSIKQLPLGATIGTSSLRRQCQLLLQRPDLIIKFLRGNINTRIEKLDQGQYDGIVLAAAGCFRLQLQHRMKEELSFESMLPAAGQGAIGIEILVDRQDLMGLMQPIHDVETALCVQAERDVVRCLNGHCQLPIASFAFLKGKEMHLNALVGSPDAKRIIQAHVTALPAVYSEAGAKVAKKLIKDGAYDILAALMK